MNVEELTMKNKTILLLIIALVSVSQIVAMHHVWKKVIGRNFGRKLITKLAKAKADAKEEFSSLMTVLHLGISTGPIIYMGIMSGKDLEMFGGKFRPRTKNVSKNVELFVQETLHDNSIKVTEFSNKICFAAKSTSKQIILNTKNKHETGLNNLDELIEKRKELTESGKQLSELEKQELEKVKQELSGYKFFLSHEDNHRKALDIPYLVVAACAIPLGTHCIPRMIGRKILTSATSSSGIRWFFKELSKLPTGCAKLLVNVGLWTACSRHCEQKADDNIPDDVAILQGGIRFLKHAKKISKKKLQEIKKTLSLEQRKTLALIQTLSPVFDLNPSNEKRIKKLKERIKKLDSQCSPGNEQGLHFI